jgi:hypothetical protein
MRCPVPRRQPNDVTDYAGEVPAFAVGLMFGHGSSSLVKTIKRAMAAARSGGIGSLKSPRDGLAENFGTI